MDLWNDGGVSRHIDAHGLVVPWVLPAQQGRAILLSAVHEEEPHAGAQGSGREAVERSDRVDVDGVVGLACHDVCVV